MFFALDQSLTDIKREGVLKRYACIKARADLLRNGMRRRDLDFWVDGADTCSVQVPAFVSVHDLHARLREKFIIIHEGTGCFVGQVFSGR